MYIQDAPGKILVVPAMNQDIDYEDIKKSQAKYIKQQKIEKAEDRFASRTLKAANIGTGIGLASGLAITHALMKTAQDSTAKKYKLLAGAVITGLTALTARWQTAGLYTIASSARKALNKNKNEFDKQQLKDTAKDGATGAAINASINLVGNALSGQNLGSGLLNDTANMATAQIGINAINKAKAIKKAHKQAENA